MTVWNSSDFTHTLRQTSWMASTAVLMHLNERSTGDPARNWLSSWAHRYFVGSGLRVLVLGCGEGWLEREIIQWPFVARVDAIDAAAEAVARARAQATNIHYEVADLNRAKLEANAYDVVIAHSILHHISNLEHAFDEIELALKPDATLIVNEYVGPNRFQFSDHVLRLMNELLACLPASHRGKYDRKERASVDFMISHDPTEAVRAEDILPMVQQRFDVLERKRLGGTVLMHLLYDIVQNFRWEDPHDRSILEMLCAFEGELVDRGDIESDFVILAARKKTSQLPRSAYSRPVAARPAAATDTESDPLGFGRRRRGAPRSAGPLAGGRRPPLLAPWMLRVLRLALVSARPRRANLIAESRVRAGIEQLRYAASRTTPFGWIRSRWSACDDNTTIGALLETFERQIPR